LIQINPEWQELQQPLPRQIFSAFRPQVADSQAVILVGYIINPL
jgi:hypothetical protein